MPRKKQKTFRDKLGTGLFDMAPEMMPLASPFPIGSGLFGQDIPPMQPPGWVSAEGGAGYQDGMAADAMPIPPEWISAEGGAGYQNGMAADPSEMGIPAGPTAAPPTGGQPQKTPFGDRFMEMLNNPMFQVGVGLLGNARSPNPYGAALQSTLQWQNFRQNAEQAKLRNAMYDRQIQDQEARTGLDKRRLEMDEQLRPAAAAKQLMDAQLDAQKIAAADRDRKVKEAVYRYFGLPIPVDEGMGGAEPQAPAQMAGQMPESGILQAQMPAQQPMQPGMQGAPQGGAMSMVDPSAIMADFAFGGGKNIGTMINDASKPITLPNGVVVSRQGNTVRPMAGSLETARAAAEIGEAVKGQYGDITVPMSDGRSVTMSRTEFRNWSETGQLPARYGGQAAPQSAAPVSPVSQAMPKSGAFVAGSEYGTPSLILDNLMQTESSGDPLALNKQTKALGPYQFLPETLVDLRRRGVAFDPMDPKQARSAADWYIQDLARQSGGDLNKALSAYGGFKTKDPTDYLTKVMRGYTPQQQAAAPVQVAGQAQAMQAPPMQAAPVAGMTEAPATVAERVVNQEQQKKHALNWEDRHNTMVDASFRAQGKIANAQALNNYLDQIETGRAAPSLLEVYKLAEMAGFKVPKDANAMEAFRALSREMAMELRDPSQGGGMPGAMSNWEQQLLQSMAPSLDKLPEANRLIVNAFMRRQQRTVAHEAIMRQYKEERGRIDSDVMDRITAFNEQNPLFTPEERATIESALKQKEPEKKAAPDEEKGIVGKTLDFLRGKTEEVGKKLDELGGQKSSKPKFLGFE